MVWPDKGRQADSLLGLGWLRAAQSHPVLLRTRVLRPPPCSPGLHARCGAGPRRRPLCPCRPAPTAASAAGRCQRRRLRLQLHRHPPAQWPRHLPGAGAARMRLPGWPAGLKPAVPLRLPLTSPSAWLSANGIEGPDRAAPTFCPQPAIHSPASLSPCSATPATATSPGQCPAAFVPSPAAAAPARGHASAPTSRQPGALPVCSRCGLVAARCRRQLAALRCRPAAGRIQRQDAVKQA